MGQQGFVNLLMKNNTRMVREIHALIDAMSKEEKEELTSLQIMGGGAQDF